MPVPSDLWSGLFCFQADIFVLILVGEMERKTLSIWPALGSFLAHGGPRAIFR